ncbi:MAG: hydantoinase/oxoprolinase family protein [Armatimonadota bacterium]
MTKISDSLGLGIDAGGTYTDGVIVDLHKGLVLSKFKTPTMKDDLPGSIRNCMASLDAELLAHCSIASLSTTFATNAIVEHKGARSGILLLGYDDHDSNRVQADNKKIVVGKYDVRGREVDPLDEAGLRTAIHTLVDDIKVEAIAISGMGGVKNPAHELSARRIAMQECSLPIVCGHELSMELDAIKRATTAYLNAKLLPVVVHLIKAVEGELSVRGVKAPLVVVRSDGSLMSASEALSNPIHTIFSGPAASAIGALYLSGLKDAVIVDIGGTTTDILFAKDGVISMTRSGSVVSGFAVSAPSVSGHTTGFGGDSHIRRDILKRVTVGPERVVPISYLALKHKSVIDDLRQMLDEIPDPLCQPTDFYIKGWMPLTTDASERETRIIAALEDGPKSIGELARLSGCDYPSLLSVDRLDRMGVIMRAGLTPTDILHAVGRLDVWDTAAAKLAVELYASDMGVSQDELCSLVMEEVRVKLSREIIEGTLENGVKGPYVPGRFTSFARTLGNVKSDYINFNAYMTQPIIGIGAPVRAYLPDVCRQFNSEPVIPLHAEVANAVGAVAGRIALKSKATVSLSSDGEYLVHTQLDFKAFTDMEEAEKYAISQVKKILVKRVHDDYPGLRFKYDIKADRRNAESMDASVFIETDIIGMAVCVSISSKVQSID